MNDNANKKSERGARPPVVVVLGHVDHGKTSILDRIRETKIAEKEAGGITQHIGAYQAKHNGKIITFLDTPGHEAFSAIRSRGVNVADVAVLVIAADEGIKPQTKEAINILQKAKIPFIVGLNKIDKEGANPARVKQELAEQQVFVEGYGGQVPALEISARTGQGINELLEMILLVSELEELPNNPDEPATGVVIESHKDERRGMVATILIRNGTLRVNDWIVAGSAIGHVKLMENFLSATVMECGPSEPCRVLGWEGMPYVGQAVRACKNQEEAQNLALEAEKLGPQTLFIREESSEGEKTNKKIANLIIKADVNSSLEAMDQVLKAIHSEEVAYRVISYGIGSVNVNDVHSARASKASICGFNVYIDTAAQQLAEREHITIKTAPIIYELVETVRAIMSDLLEPEIKRVDLGKIKVLALFKQDGKSQIVGGKVTSGKAVRGAIIDVIRGGNLIINGKLGQLQQSKDDVAEVKEGFECGLRFDMIKNFSKNPRVQFSVAVGDVLEIYQEEKIQRSL